MANPRLTMSLREATKIDPEEYRPLARRLATFAVTCMHCGWPEDQYRDIGKAARLVEFLADFAEMPEESERG